ncbi:hypothetical protein [Sulfurisphaera ohwakuensis]|uniref:hypothetical protein n=1 Tax=Sulfurisphaera ohwakuensis TaxID=69656 RepID=UPI0036F39999
MRYIYCVKGDYLVPCTSPTASDEYYIFEYTKDLQLILTRCKNEECKEIEPSYISLKFNLPEASKVEELLNRLSTFRSFLQKHNLKVYFMEDTSVLEAIINPKLYYYKYLALDKDFRDRAISQLEKWVSRFLLFVRVVEELGVIKFIAHLDSLDGRYTLWIKENFDEPSTIAVTEKEGEIKLWFGFKDCDLYIKNKEIEKCYKIEK